MVLVVHWLVGLEDEASEAVLLRRQVSVHDARNSGASVPLAMGDALAWVDVGPELEELQELDGVKLALAILIRQDVFALLHAEGSQAANAVWRRPRLRSP